MSDSSEYISSTYTTSNCTPQTSFESSATPFPSMTKSQRVRLNEIIHHEPIGYASSFDMIEIAPVDSYAARLAEQQTQVESAEEQKQNHGCCVIS